jgi:hypothetical protein
MTAAAETLMPNRDLTHEIAGVAEVGGCMVDQYGTSGDEAAVWGGLVKMPEMLRRHVQERMMQNSQHVQALGFGGAPGFSFSALPRTKGVRREESRSSTLAWHMSVVPNLKNQGKSPFSLKYLSHMWIS